LTALYLLPGARDRLFLWMVAGRRIRNAWGMSLVLPIRNDFSLFAKM